MFILEVLTVLKFPARFANFCCSARPGINILIYWTNFDLYNGLTIFCERGGGYKLMNILLSTVIIFDLISVQLQTCGMLKQNIIFRILGNLEKF